MRLKGVSVARRKCLKPPLVTTSRIRASPACAPRHMPTSCARDAGVQITRVGAGLSGQSIRGERPLRQSFVQTELVTHDDGRRMHHRTEVMDKVAHEDIEFGFVYRHGFSFQDKDARIVRSARHLANTRFGVSCNPKCRELRGREIGKTADRRIERLPLRSHAFAFSRHLYTLPRTRPHGYLITVQVLVLSSAYFFTVFSSKRKPSPGVCGSSRLPSLCLIWVSMSRRKLSTWSSMKNST